ncbi:PKD domain-containing protein [Algoriphagus antarcticus]|uniref:PKD domain-containing protein n=1 Tax=Algoriphagus antarcticus TaxID=238540 RepID=A0A3E0D7F6_9BACT|nr:PKD domain-containing protein [Algoriphagus antarcticus]REG78507.1 hypothetical protein C8N25_13341 [Algoriphagus antarcticus]
MSNKLKLAIVVYFLFQTISAQNYVGPSPNSMGIVRMTNQVNLLTGSPNINIPLVNLPGKELSASISLSYNSFGHRVQDLASSEGLGWSLMAGGVVTRVVRGEPDDLAGGYCKPNPTDTEPDIYTFSAGGISGKFVLDRNGIPLLMPYQDVVIKPGICRSGGSGTWEITDANGVKYFFGTNSNFQETTTYRKTTASSTTSKTYTSSWLLERIVSPNGTDVATYFYSTSTNNYESYSYIKDTGAVPNPNVVVNNSYSLTQNVKNLLSITTSGGSAVFTYSIGREDVVGGKYLESIRVLDHLGAQSNKLSFKYGYFGSGGAMCKRLRLESIHDLGSNPIYSFSYNQTINLPCRDSKSIDYLGLYNSYTGTDWIPASIENMETGTRKPDAARMKANLLTRIDFRGGGYTLYDFEPHSGVVKFGVTYINAYAYPVVVDQLMPVLSGNRISKIRKYDGTGTISVLDYKYEKTITQSGQQVLISSGEINRHSFFKLNFPYLTRWFSHNQADIFDANGIFVGYTRVVEIENGKGATEYIFSGSTFSQTLNTDTPVSFWSTRFWERGLLLSKKAFLQGDNLTPLYSEVFEYDLNIANLRSISGKEEMKVLGNNGIQTKESNYTFISKPITLTKKTTTYRDQVLSTKTYATVEQYSYQTPTYQIASVSAWNSTNPNEKSISVTKYITNTDYNYSTSNCETQLTVCLNSCTNGGSTCENNCYIIYNNCNTQALNAMGPEGKAIVKMRELHMNNAVVESQSFIQRGGVNYLTAASINKYSYFSGWIYPQSQWISKKNTATNYTGSKINASGGFDMSPLFVEVSNQTYNNATGKLTSQTHRNGIKVDYTYSNNNMTLASSTVSPASNPFTSNYLYKPMVGVTKETDQNNKAVNMEYDGLNRLRLVKDNSNNIRERYRYHSKNETPNFRIAATNSQIAAGQSVTFSLEDIIVPSGGTTTRHWTTGTGVSYTDNRTTMNYTYPTPGLYTITSTLLTNEFNSVTKSYNLLVTGALQITICANGAQEKDLCNPATRVWGSCTASQVDTGYTRFQTNFSPLTSTGCVGIYNYHFEYQQGGLWLTFSNGVNNYADFVNTIAPGYYNIRCTITDSCSNTAVANSFMNIYESNPLCTPIEI